MEESKAVETEESKPETLPAKEDSLKDKLSETIELLKKKIAALNEKNKALLAKCKEQSEKLKTKTMELSEKSIMASKTFYGKLKLLFTRPEPKAKLIVIDIAGKQLSYKGKIIENKAGFIRLKEAELVTYSDSTSNLEVLASPGHVFICRDNIALISDL